MLWDTGADRVLAMDLHSGQCVGYFDIPVDHVYGDSVLLDYLASKRISTGDLVRSLPSPPSPPLSSLQPQTCHETRFQGNSAFVNSLLLHTHIQREIKADTQTEQVPELTGRAASVSSMRHICSNEIHLGKLNPSGQAGKRRGGGVKRVLGRCYFQVVVSPDVGGVARARAFAKKLNDAPLAIVDKRRSAHNVSEVMNLIGDVKDKVAVLVDDMIDTAGAPREHCYNSHLGLMEHSLNLGGGGGGGGNILMTCSCLPHEPACVTCGNSGMSLIHSGTTQPCLKLRMRDLAPRTPL